MKPSDKINVSDLVMVAFPTGEQTKAYIAEQVITYAEIVLRKWLIS